ncbi:MAG: Maf family protein [Bdellovibrionaceae bacterium]|nr:Maf family protein [Pseudobdellovibrionaceae bacterium]
MKIILASQSPSRKKLLNKLGLKFEILAPNINEEKFLDVKNPENSCYQVAKQKALIGKNKYNQDIIIACDQMVYLDGELFGKAYTEKQAIQNLIQLQGKTHILISALCMLWEKKEFYHISKSYLKMRHLTLRQIKNYVMTDKPLKSAGSYHIESTGIALFEKVKTDDFYSIQGLPLIQVANQLLKWNYPLFSKSFLYQNCE